MADTKVKFTSDTTGVTQGVAKIHSSIAGLKSSVSSMGSAFKSALGPITAITAVLGGLGVGAGLKDIFTFSGEIADMSTALDIGADDLVVFRQALDMAGVSVDKLQPILAKMSNAIQTPSPQMLVWLRRFGVELEDIQAKGVAGRFESVMSGIGGLATATDRLAASNAFLGPKLGSTIIPLARTKDAMKDAKEITGGLGVSMMEFAEKMDKVGDIFGSVGTKARQFFAGLVGQNIENLITLADKFKGIDLTSFGKAIGDNIKVISDIIVSLSDAYDKGGIQGLVNTVGDGFKLIWAESKAFLVATFEYLGQVLVKSITKGIQNSPLGALLESALPDNINQAPKRNELIKEYQKAEDDYNYFNSPFVRNIGRLEGGVNTDKYLTDKAKEMALLGGMIDSYKNYTPALKSFGDMLKDQRAIENVAELRKKFWGPKKEGDKNRKVDQWLKTLEEVSEWGPEFLAEQKAAMEKVFTDYDQARNAPKIEAGFDLMDNLEGYLDAVDQWQKDWSKMGSDYINENTSLGRMGGDIGSSRINTYIENPLVTLQQRANSWLQKISDNTAKITAPAWQ